MKQFKRSALARIVARVLVVLMGCPIFILGVIPAFAQAPAGTPTGVAATSLSFETKYVGVLDFSDSSHSNNPFIGRQAADAVANSIAQHRSVQFDWEVLPRDVVQSALTQSHLQLPLDAEGIKQLGQIIRNPPGRPGEGRALNYIVTGDVQQVNVNRKNHQAAVQLEVRAYDADSGALINGAVGQRASAMVYNTASTDLLVNQALENAAFDAVGKMSLFTLPNGIIMDLTQTSADLSLGTTSGVHPGQEFIVTRGSAPYEQYVGRVRVTEVDPDSSRGAIVDNARGIQTGDRIRQAFTVAEIEHPQPAGHTAARSALNPWMVVLALGGLIGAGILVNNRSTSTLASPTGVHAVATQVNGNAAVRVSWSDSAPFPVYTQLPAVTGTGVIQNILEYNIYRSQGNPGVLEPAGCTGPAFTTFLDAANIAANVSTGNCSFTQTGFVATGAQTTGTTTAGTTTATTTATTTGTTTSGTNFAAIVPLLSGTRYFYYVSRLVFSTPGALLLSQGNTGGLNGTTGGFNGGGLNGTTGGFNGGGLNGTTGGFNGGGLSGGFNSGGLSGGFNSGGLSGGFNTGGFRSNPRASSRALMFRDFQNRAAARQVGRTPLRGSAPGRQFTTGTTGTTGINNTTGTNNNNGQFIESFLSGSAGPVTPISPPALSTPAAFETTQLQTDISNVIFTFTPTRGANQYEIQVSDSANFDSSRTYTSPLIQDPSAGAAGTSGTLSTPGPINLTTVFPPTLFGQPKIYDLFVRVGARNGSDNGGDPSLQAIPDPQSSLDLGSDPPRNRFVFSIPVHIQTQPAPPAQPGGLTTTGSLSGGPPPPPGGATATTTTGGTTGTTTATTGTTGATTGTTTATTGGTTGTTTGPPPPPLGRRHHR